MDKFYLSPFQKYSILLITCLCLVLVGVAQTPITAISTSTSSATSSSYTSGSTYSWGTGNDEYLDSINISGTSYAAASNTYGKTIQFKRVDNANATGERCQIFVERNSDTDLEASYPVDGNGDCSMITALSELIINRGALDVFHNVTDGVEYPNNVERVDVLISGMLSPRTGLLDEIGFLATEKRGNNDFKAAAILSVDTNGEPTSYGNLVTVDGTPSYTTLGTTYNFRFFKDAASAPHGLPVPFYNSTEQTGFSLITFDDLGLTEGQKIYGISFFGSDVSTSSHTLTDPTTFPQTTNEGADIHGGLGSIFHTSAVSLTELQDHDNDGIADFDDIDDDNDGTLDTDECLSYGPELVVNGDFEDAYAHWTSDFNRGINNNGPTSDGCVSQGWVAISPCATVNGSCAPYYEYNGSTPTGSTLITDAYGTGANVLSTTTCNQTISSCLAEALPDHTTGSGLSVYIDPSNVAGRSYWQQSVSIEANKTYEFSAWIMVIEEDPNLEFKIDGISLTGQLNLDRLTGGSDGTDEWQQITGWWNSGSVSGSVVLELVNLTAGCAGNDIRIDDISLRTVLTCDTDNDGVADHLDIDADNDGIVDNTEAQSTAGYTAPSNVDTDNDGLDDAYDTDCAPCGGVTGVAISPVDTDSDGLKDFEDLDSDNDGISDLIEGHDTNGDGTVDGSDSPNANTGLAGGTTDTDGDGLLDGFDNDTADPDPTNGSLTAESHPDVQAGGTAEQDWREGTDSDRDGIPDIIDIDDDNDGIPDTNECNGTFTLDGSHTASTYTGTDFTSIASDVQFDINLLNGITFNTAVGPSISNTDTGKPSPYNGSQTHLYLEINTDKTVENHGLFTITFPRTVIDPTISFSDLSSNTVAPDWSLSLISLNPSVSMNLIYTDGDFQIAGDTIRATENSSTNGTGVVEFIGRVKKLQFQIGHYTESDLDGPVRFALNTGFTLCSDSDGDGIENSLDLDSDNDGIPDIIEAGGIDSDGNGRVDNDTDSDSDGLANTFETADGSTSILLDTDGDGTTDQDGDIDNDGLANWIDLDADGDGILDVEEVGAPDTNKDGIADNTTDVDEDGYFDAYDPDASDGPGGSGTNGTALITVSADGSDENSRPDHFSGAGIADSDGDDVPNFLDVDSDNDGIYDIYESQGTTGFIPSTGNDSDGDGIDNAFDDDDANYGGAGAAGTSPVNTDSGTGDTKEDYLDSDSDDDGVPDMQEAWDSLDDGDSQPDAVSGSCTTDTDGDGLVDCFDSNDGDKSVWTIAISPPDDDGTAGATTSAGVNITASNDVDDIFPNNANGDSSTEPDWRDVGNAACATAATIYAISDAGTAYEWNSSTQKHQTAFSTGIVRATSFCIVSGGWYRFYNPLEPDKYLFAIQNGTNTVDLSTVIDYVEIEVQSEPVTTNGSDHGFIVMARSWKVVTKGSLDGTVNIRFYFNPSEYSSFTSSADNMVNSYVGGSLETAWFKINSGLDYSNIPNDPDSYAADNYTDLNSLVAGQATGQVDTDFSGNNKNHVQFDGLTGFSGGTFGGETAGTLPVEWLSFDAHREGESAKLTWETAVESNNDRFEVERSIDKRIFTPIGQVKSIGNSTETTAYTFFDDDLREAKSSIVNYRLKQVDIDGSFSYSKTIELQLLSGEDLFMIIYPNPAEKFIHIRYNFSILAQKEKELRVYDVLSHEVYGKTLPGDAHSGELSIPIDSWRKGYYYVSISTEKAVKVYKVMIK